MLKENIDYYINEDGNFVFTKDYHLKRGFCCKNRCLHCPWDYGKPQKIQNLIRNQKIQSEIENPKSEINKDI